MDEAQLIALVVKALSLHQTTGCLYYIDGDLENRVRQELASVGTIAAIKALLVNYATNSGIVEIRRETRAEYQSRREFWFRVLVPIVGSPKPLFFELELTDEDCDYPSVAILNVHF